MASVPSPGFDRNRLNRVRVISCTALLRRRLIARQRSFHGRDAKVFISKTLEDFDGAFRIPDTHPKKDAATALGPQQRTSW